MMSSTMFREELERIASSGTAAFKKARELLRLSKSMRVARDLRAALALQCDAEGDRVRSRLMMETVTDLDRLVASARSMARGYLELSSQKLGFGSTPTPQAAGWKRPSAWRPSDQAGAQ